MDKLKRQTIQSKTLLALGGMDRIAAEVEESTSHGNAPLLAGLVENALVKAPQVVYNATKEGMKTLFLIWQ